MTIEDKQALQESQYTSAYHWDENKRVENRRYLETTRLLFDLCVGGGEQGKRNRAKGDGFRVCDFGCGDGRGTYVLWQQFLSHDIDVEMLGIDISAKAVHWAREMAVPRDDSLSFEVGDIEKALEFFRGGGNNILVMREVVEHLQESEIDEIFGRLLKENEGGCRIVASTPSINSPVERKHYRHYTVASLRDSFERNGLQVQQVLGFGYRPRRLFRLLQYSKARLNQLPVLWRIMNPAWRVVDPSNAITLVAVAKCGT